MNIRGFVRDDTPASPEDCPLRVLVVDDELSITKLLATGLRLDGQATLTTTSVAEAKTLLATHGDIGVVISDINMPSRMASHSRENS